MKYASVAARKGGILEYRDTGYAAIDSTLSQSGDMTDYV